MCIYWHGLESSRLHVYSNCIHEPASSSVKQYQYIDVNNFLTGSPNTNPAILVSYGEKNRKPEWQYKTDSKIASIRQRFRPYHEWQFNHSASIDKNGNEISTLRVYLLIVVIKKADRGRRAGYLHIKPLLVTLFPSRQIKSRHN